MQLLAGPTVLLNHVRSASSCLSTSTAFSTLRRHIRKKEEPVGSGLLSSPDYCDKKMGSVEARAGWILIMFQPGTLLERRERLTGDGPFKSE